MILAIDGVFVPTCPASARGHRPVRKRHRAKRTYWRGQ
jgi:hypothetical protein